MTFQSYTKGKSDQIYASVESGLSTIPQTIRDALTESGYTLVIAPTMLSAIPEWEGGTPRGWSEESNYDNVGGLFQGRSLRIVIPESVQDRQHPTKYNVNERAEMTVRHEFGHAFDYYQGRVSMSQDFVDAYAADYDRLNPAQQQRFHYFLQPNGAGYTELFAELFAAAYTPNADSDEEFADLIKSFPKTTALILKLNPKRAKWEKKQVQTEAPPVKAAPAEWNPPSEPTSSMLESYRKISLLYQQGKLAEVEPLMASYIREMEQNSVARDRLRQTYQSYAALLHKLHKEQQAKAIEAKLQNPSLKKVDLEKAGVVGLKFVATGKFPLISLVYSDTPASKAGFRHGDEIIEINDVKLPEHASVDDVYAKVVGPPGTNVKITVLRSGTRITATLRRVAVTQLPSAAAQNDYKLQNR